jgi:putative DNA methylase
MLQPYEWKDKPALIEHVFPVQKISAESFKEQMAGAGKTLTALGSYWKGRKPLILNKACILGTLLPISGDLLKDLEIFEMLMGMDNESLEKRLDVKNDKASRFFLAQEQSVKSDATYNEWVRAACRPEECGDELFSHIWANVNAHLGTSASSFPELVEQMGIARFGHRPRVADVFSGSGQIPFEAARLGCDVYASDLNPIACMLTWGGFNIVGASPEKRIEIDNAQKELAQKVQTEIDALGVETDGKGWLAKAFLYCVEVVCPESGWKVPLIPSLIISQPRTGEKNNVVAKLVPVPTEKRYDIEIIEWVNEDELINYKNGTIQSGEITHSPDGKTIYRVSIGNVRGDYKDGKENKNSLRLWEKSDFIPRPDDVFQERLYCIQWIKKKPNSEKFEYQFRTVTADDLKREQKVIDFVSSHLADWQEKGFVPDMVIEAGAKTDEPIRTRGWSHWHHLFNARQLLVAGFVNQFSNEIGKFGLSSVLNWNARLSIQ